MTTETDLMLAIANAEAALTLAAIAAAKPEVDES